MEHTLVAVFENESLARQACDDLAAAGFSRSDMRINAAQPGDLAGTSAAGVDTAALEHESIGSRIKDFFHDLFTGEDSERAAVYSEAARRGGHVLTLTAADDEQIDRATEILDRLGPINIEEREAEWRSSGWAPESTATAAGTAASAAGLSDSMLDTTPAAGTQPATQTGAAPQMGTERAGTRAASDTEQVIPVVEEQLQVGKRTVQRGGVRVVQRVTEKPAQESVQLHDERVTIERRPVDQAAGSATGEGLQERTVEVRETVEEPVIAKTARVVEEVVIGKEQRDRTETVQDTVRRTDVDVEQLGAQAAGTAGTAGTGSVTDDTDFRSHWQSSYAQQGGRYEDYAPAYQYGSTLGSDERYRGQSWEAIEPRVRADWESTHAGSAWEKTKDAVRTGWEKMTR